jgi:hypothetical protein
MKSSRIFAVAALVLASVLPRAEAACTNATLAGTFGFTTTGVLILPTGPVPVGAVGLITFDLNGNASGSQDRSVGGAFAHETLRGSFTINSNCTASLVTNVYDSSGNLARTGTLDGVLAENGKQIRAIFESVTLPNGTSLPSVLTIEGNRVRAREN